MKDSYYSRSELSNSDLSSLKKLLYPSENDINPEAAYKFGNLVDAMSTEPSKLDFFKRTHSDYDAPYTKEDWNKAEKMVKSLNKDEFFRTIKPYCEYQKVFSSDVTFKYGSFEFTLRMRCKFDLWMEVFGYGGDLKSTTAKTQKEFEAACYHFDYDRQRVVYMLLSGSKKDILIGISKENYKVFKIPITCGDSFYNSGLEKLKDIGFKYWCLYEDFKI